MGPILAPVTACRVSAVPGHPLGMQQSGVNMSVPHQYRWTALSQDERLYETLERHLQEKFEMFNLDMKIGDTLKVKGKISDDTDGFSINLGCSSSDLALHFNPRFNESVIVCNSKCKKAWQEEHRDDHLCFSRGSTIKIVIEMKADKFQVKLPDDHKVEFPNRHCYEKVNYMSVKGGFKVTSFKLD